VSGLRSVDAPLGEDRPRTDGGARTLPKTAFRDLSGMALPRTGQVDSFNRSSQNRETDSKLLRESFATRPRMVPMLRPSRFPFIFATDFRNMQDPMFTGRPAMLQTYHF
jgi:hypothetical protein